MGRCPGFCKEAQRKNRQEISFVERGGMGIRDPCGDNDSVSYGRSNYGEPSKFLWVLYVQRQFQGTIPEKTIAVGSFSPNAFGLYDMHGNIWEWVGDCGNNNYHGAPANGGVWSDGNCSLRVLRGGSWDSAPESLRASKSLRIPNGRAGSGLAFRIARTLF